MVDQQNREQDDDGKPCLPSDNSQIVPPGEVTSVVAGAGIGLALGLAIGVALGLKLGSKS